MDKLTTRRSELTETLGRCGVFSEPIFKTAKWYVQGFGLSPGALLGLAWTGRHLEKDWAKQVELAEDVP